MYIWAHGPGPWAHGPSPWAQKGPHKAKHSLKYTNIGKKTTPQTTNRVCYFLNCCPLRTLGWLAGLGPCCAPRSPLGMLLAPPEGSSRHRGRSRERFWQSPGALLGLFGAPGPHSRVFFLSGKAFCFGVLRHRNRNRNRLLVFSFGNFRSTWALALVSRAWACALESWALARGSWALAWGHGLELWGLGL